MPSGDVRVQSLAEEAPERVLALWTEAGLSHRPRGRDRPDRLEAEFRRNADLALGAYVEDRLVGAVVGTDDGRKGWINRLAVAPSHRRQGIGTTLIRHLEEGLRRRGRRLFAALVEGGNPESEAFFESLGYEVFRGVSYLTKRDSPEV